VRAPAGLFIGRYRKHEPSISAQFDTGKINPGPAESPQTQALDLRHMLLIYWLSKNMELLKRVSMI
jgi:hypothetical protein